MGWSLPKVSDCCLVHCTCNQDDLAVGQAKVRLEATVDKLQAQVKRQEEEIQSLTGEIKRLEKLNRWEQGRRLNLEGQVEDLRDQLRAARGARKARRSPPVAPW